MKSILLCVLCLFSINSFAVFQRVWNAYKKSKTKEIRDVSVESLKHKYEFDKSFAPLNLELSRVYNDDALKKLNSFSPRETILTTYSAKLTKPTINYGSFFVEHKHIEYDLSNWQPALKANLTGDNQYDIRTVFGYSYDFFKKDMQMQSALVRVESEQSLTLARLEQEKEYLSIFTRFIQAKLSLYQVRLSRENALKAKKRIKLIKKRVKTGSSRKVDLYLSRSAFYTQTEGVENAKNSLEENLSILEFILGVKIDNSLLSFITWEKTPTIYEGVAKTNLDLKLLEKRLELSEVSLKQTKNSNRASLSLNLQYETNGLRNDRSKSFDETFEGFNNKTAALSLVIPLDFSKNSAVNTRTILENKLSKLQLENKKGEIETKVSALRKQIFYTQQAFNDSKKRTRALRMASIETNKLYSRGQSNFDEVIRREENYIGAQISEKANLSKLELLIANLAFLEGNIESYLDSYRD